MVTLTAVRRAQTAVCRKQRYLEKYAPHQVYSISSTRNRFLCYDWPNFFPQYLNSPPGIAALGERNVDNGKRAVEFKREAHKLRHVKGDHHKKLLDLHREARANVNYSADLQVQHHHVGRNKERAGVCLIL